MPVSYDLSGQSAVVTGGARGIGRAIAERLTAAGARVWVWDIAPVELPGIPCLAVDVTRPEQIEAAIARVLGETGGAIDILVSNAGYGGAVASVEHTPRDETRRIVEVNLLATIDLCRQIVPVMRRKGSGRIVTMGSFAAKDGMASLASYSAASAGVLAFTKALGRELATTGIRVNGIAPAAVDTELIRAMGDAAIQAMVARTPMGRLGTVEEVAALVLWLCSDACSFNAGAVFDLSGGRASY